MNLCDKPQQSVTDVTCENNVAFNLITTNKILQ